MAVDLTELAIILQDTLTRIDNLVFTTGAPAAELGTINSMALDVAAKVLYGPKTALGWGAGTPLTGADGRDPEFRASGGYLQVRLAGDDDTMWQNLIPIADLPKGDPGPTPVISIGAVTTAPTGDPADASFTGTAAEPVLNLTLPRGDTGLTGANGWTAVEANVVDGERRVKQVVDWIGGTGAKPATGKFIGPAGLVDTAAEATDMRGAGGSGSGDMLGSQNLAELTDVGAARTKLSVYSKAETDTALENKQASLGFTPEDVSKKGAANGYAGLDGSGKVPAALLPAPPTVPVKASGAELRTGTDDAKFLTAKSSTDAGAYVTTTWAASLALNLSIPAQIVTLGGNTTLTTPTGAKPGIGARVLLKQPAAGGPYTVSYASAYAFFGTTPAVSTAANAVDMLVLDPETSAKISADLRKGRAA